ncbi:MAG TPA: Gfo/Idh/MocA family oxidoreductase [Trueperaceae bacterium]|nr:Gfo/Idh/MocA family oxidoreductase [Trueperaceae bacterium]
MSAGACGGAPSPAPVGLGLIGVGRWGLRLGAAAGRAAGVRVVSCFARDPASRAEAAEALGCRPAASAEALLEHPGVEAVAVATPNHAHEALTLAAAGHGKHVFVEKPIATEVAAARRMAAACTAAGVTLQVGHGFRRLGASRAAARLVAGGALGRVVLAEANFSLPGAFAPGNWRASRETLAGGPLMQLGVHHADTLLAWLGPAVKVSGSLAHLAAGVDIDDVAVALLEHASGARSVIACSYVSPASYRLRLYGTEANLELRTAMALWPHAERMDAGTTLSLERRGGVEAVPFEPQDMLVDELEAFARSVRSGAQPETGAAEGIAALEVVLGAVASSQQGGRALPLTGSAPAQATRADAGPV